MASSLLEAISAVTEAQARLLEATKALVDHNLDLHSHPDLREEIKKVVESDIPYTKAEVENLASKAVTTHASLPLEQAHPDFDVFKAETLAGFETLKENIKVIEEKLAGAEIVDRNTELQKALAAIEAKYSVILDNLQNSYQIAFENGNIILAEEYKKTIASTLDEKKTELLAAMEAWQQG